MKVDLAAHAYEAEARGAWNSRLIEQYLPLVRRIAGRLAISLPPHVDEDDLVGYGVFGLLDALERFDQARGVKFETYASVRIRGAMLDGLRVMDWVPHSARQKIKQLQEAMAELEAQLGRPATVEELAGSLGTNVREVESVLVQSQTLTLSSLDEMVTGDDGGAAGSALDLLTDATAEQAFAAIEQREQHQFLAEAIAKLPEKEQLVLALYYQEELTLKEIAAVMQLSESRICQLHSQAILRLRGRLSRYKTSLL